MIRDLAHVCPVPMVSMESCVHTDVLHSATTVRVRLFEVNVFHAKTDFTVRSV